MEECAEVQQACSKALRFGIDDKFEDQPTPHDQINLELNDLFTIINMLKEEDIATDYGNIFDIHDKQDRVEHYMQYAIDRGLLE